MCAPLKVIPLLLLLLSVCACSNEPSAGTSKQKEITIHAAVSLSAMVRELGDRFSAKHNLSINYNFASSGALARQLIAAPRGEIYLSANQQWMQRALEANAVDRTSAQALFANQLVLVSHTDAPIQTMEPLDICHATTMATTRISIGDPDYVPAGQYARAWLQSLSCGESNAWEAVKERVIPATDAHAALARVQANRDMIGIVYLTDYLTQVNKLQLLHTIPTEATAPIHYYGAVINNSPHAATATAFLNYLQSKQNQQVVEKYGFTPINRSLTRLD
ncbi:molybdate ABC transporter substrate-binding protein [Coraliomargarita sp. SDUM461003]|uniref:Molybdate ABC transporter substrate-binding protein n=1 Tax=Thalassobacterium maritimum TaxID=3041265 RepID=A0ABU1AVX3_9BACT|nr:molybdate ABC transporter substrate-binding protein [Coraliomargarita sp. SDUM461003]MDQ8208303.1 molybdate ABC transporter substrate-binding protein [Coraliomargarita sp. SDUM461003]